MASSATNATGDTPAESSQPIRASDVPVKKAPSLCDEHHDMVTIFMKGQKGKPDRKYIMHKSIACHHSPVLNKAFNGPFVEGQTQTFTIDDFEWPEAFGVIQSWMYAQKTDGWKEELGESFPTKIGYAWILADRMLMPKLQNAVMILLSSLEAASTIPHKIAYENTPPGSKLRRFVCDRYACFSVMEHHKATWLAYKMPAELLLDMLMAKSRPVPPTLLSMKAEDYFVPEA
ncbi:hypothetical protein VTL71DRAFT_8114 [Oculimacula yallundae]|uniref:BTB domain-containing protein n=1 Tax=Oculimacula yallundae TaxID=86028 RepID=A0ABR4CWM0_9HELO